MKNLVSLGRGRNIRNDFLDVIELRAPTSEDRFSGENNAGNNRGSLSEDKSV